MKEKMTFIPGKKVQLTKTPLVCLSLVVTSCGSPIEENKKVTVYSALEYEQNSGFTAIVQFFWNCSQIVRISVRLLELWIRFAPLLLWRLFWPILPQFLRNCWVYLLLLQLRNSGPCAIKLGQWVATRPDIFSEETCQQLSELHCAAPSHSFSHTRAEIERAYGKKIEEIFSEFDHKPLASGAVGQVHLARIASTNQAVVVKVKHPYVDYFVERDLLLLQTLAHGFGGRFGLEWSGITEAASQFKKMMKAQTDFLIEAENLRHFRQHFATLNHTICFPKPIDSLCESSVLVESFEPGIPMTNLLYSNAKGSFALTEEQKQKIASQGAAAFLKMLICDNFVHADLHPGNILVRSIPPELQRKYSSDHVVNQQNTYLSEWRVMSASKISPQDTNLQLVFLDVGLVTSMSTKERKNFMGLLRAIVEGNGRKSAELIVEGSPNRFSASPEMIENFCSGMSTLVSEVLARPLGDLQVGSIMRDVLRLSRENKIMLEGNFVSLVQSIIVIEGLARQLHADFSLLHEAKPLLQTEPELVQAYLKRTFSWM